MAFVAFSRSRLSAWLAAAALHGALLALIASRAGEVPPQVAPEQVIQVSLLADAPAAPATAARAPAPLPAPTPPKRTPRPAPPQETAEPLPTPVPSPMATPVAALETSEAAAEPPPEAASETTASTPRADPAGVPGAAAGGEQSFVEARFDAAYLQNPKPAYPAMSRRMREEGKVILRAYVATTGVAERVEIRTSSGSARLDAAAKSAVERWRFQPARRDGDAVAAWVLIPISFTLENS